MPNTSKHLGDRIAEQMKIKEVGPTEVAAHFGIKPPSVTSWIKTGRVAKRHLSKLVTYFGPPLSYWLGDSASLAGGLTLTAAPERAITLKDVAAIWKELTPERQRHLYVCAMNAKCAQDADKPSKGNPFAKAPVPTASTKAPATPKT